MKTLLEYLSTKTFEKKLVLSDENYPDNDNAKALAMLLVKYIMKGRTIKLSDFEKLDLNSTDNMYNICNVPQDGHLAQKFYKGAVAARHAIHRSEGKGYFAVTLLQRSKPDAIAIINLDQDVDNYNGLTHNPIGDIVSIDVSKEVMYALFNL